nr:MAG TPA: hypothetical protein [Caudoviricetes sp.]
MKKIRGMMSTHHTSTNHLKYLLLLFSCITILIL